MARVPAKIVSLLDRSGSMGSPSNYITPAKVDLDTFINMFQAGDLFSVIAFNQSNQFVYPGNSLATTSAQTLLAASNAIKPIGASGQTNIGDAIIAGTSLLNAQPEPRGMVLLSDGDWNVGPDPLKNLPSNIRIYTIALGDNGQLNTLNNIALRTNGVYSFTPDPVGLASIYFDILQYGQVGQITSNLMRTLPPSQPLAQTIPIATGTPSASIGINWADPNISFGGTSLAVPRQSAGGNQVYVEIRDPKFKVYTGPVTYDQYGFAVAPIANPMPGTWTVTTIYRGSGTGPTLTNAGLEATQTPRLVLRVPAETVRAGQPFTIRATIFDEEEPVHDVSIDTFAEVPSLSVDDALLRYARDLAEIRLPDEYEGHAAPDRVRLNILREQRKPYAELLPRHVVRGRAVADAPGEYDLHFQTDAAGEYVIRTEVLGRHPKYGTFARSGRATVQVR